MHRARQYVVLVILVGALLKCARSILGRPAFVAPHFPWKLRWLMALGNNGTLAAFVLLIVAHLHRQGH
jgi:hypothetical protein